MDGDRWAVDSPAGCEPTGMLGLGDCDDSDDSINPDAEEVCGDGVDNDCDGDVDFGLLDIVIVEDPDTGLPLPVVGLCFLHSPAGCTAVMSCMPDANCCATAGTKVCNAQRDGVICVSNNEDGRIRMVRPEGPPGSESCFDFADNDCDGCPDQEDPSCQTTESCNNLDDDFDGRIDEDFPLGQPCMVGTGACLSAGATVCSSTGRTRCSAVPLSATVEDSPDGVSCHDGIDNDCDGQADLADPECRRPETCDGSDNDGDGLADEDFPDKDSACSVGQGACIATGTKRCLADGTGTFCDAATDLSGAGVEGPVGATCIDSLDNDCDGLTDAHDPGCGSAGLTVTCALPYLQNAANGAGCESWSRLSWIVSGAPPDAEIFAELLAIGEDGAVLAVLPVGNGESAHMNSRINPANWKFTSKLNKRRGGQLEAPMMSHDMIAPIPLLRVRVKDDLNESVAYCANVPYLDIVKPNGGVVDATNEEGTQSVLAAVPLIVPGTLQVLVNGVDIFDELGINPATAFPGSHPGGVVIINGEPVTISDIVVDIAPNIFTQSSNTLRMNVTGMACGGNEIIVNGTGVYPSGTQLAPTPECHREDGHDCGSASVFQLRIDSPVSQEIVPTVPTPVRGEVCHGVEIAKASINGKALDAALQTFEGSPLECAGGTYRLEIDTTLPRTNLHADVVSATTALGTFDPGSNRLIASATDDEANRVFKTFLFAAGLPSEIVPVSLAPGLEAASAGPARKEGPTSATSTPISDSFVLGLEGEALQEFFASTCKSAAADLEEQIRNHFESCLSRLTFCSEGGYECNGCGSQSSCEMGTVFPPAPPGECRPPEPPPGTEPDPDFNCRNFLKIKPSLPVVCDPCSTMTVVPGSFEFLEDVKCDVSLTDGPGPDGTGGEIKVTLAVPQMRFSTHVGGDCHGFLWAANATIDVDADILLPKDDGARTTVTLTLTEQNFEDPTAPFQPAVLTLGSGEAVVTITDYGNTDISGWLIAIAEFLDFLLEAIGLNLFDINLPTVIPTDIFKDMDIGEKTLPIQIPQVKPDEEPYEETDKEIALSPPRIRINSHGLKALTDITLTPTMTSPSVQPSPGYFATPAPSPALPVDGGNTFITVSDDLINAALAAATTQGEISSAGCSGALSTGACCASQPPQTLGSLFPADCEDIVDGPPLAECRLSTISDNPEKCMRAVLIGTCLGIKAGDLPEAQAEDLCESFQGNLGNDIAEIVGQAVCHGVRGADCQTIPIPALSILQTERRICASVPPLHVKGSDAILTCVRNDVPPAFLIKEQRAPGVPLDAVLRLNDLLAGFVVDRSGNGFDGAELATIPSCPDNATTADCRLLSMCLDLNVEATMALGGTNDAPQLLFNLGSVMPMQRVEGEACEGDVDFKYTSDEDAAAEATSSDSVEDSLVDNTTKGTPVQKPEGITLGGVVTLSQPQIFAIRTSTTPGRCQNNLEVSCQSSADCGGATCIQFQDYVGVRGVIVPKP